MPLTLHHANPTDTPYIADLFFASFANDPPVEKLFPRAPDVRDWWIRAISQDCRNPRKRVLKVTDEGGKIIGFVLWSLPASPDQVDMDDGFSVPWPGSCDAEYGDRFFGAIHEREMEVMRGKKHYCILLVLFTLVLLSSLNCYRDPLGLMLTVIIIIDVDMLATHPTARGRGVATMLVRWGLRRAESNGIDVYLSSTQMARSVYEKLGFEARGLLLIVEGYAQIPMVWSPGRICSDAARS
ncbi:acyl-CoA N-acyltransferase [Aspergillus avenaceus]|uniref:Acyl-CoA N-acyltransferase n=1 Tax=Aspergillus avenaceus TaxID=36643 RepID=A0A5N6TTL2_ASPAV|nr:acyl-CoA N-acyltransferase [Aspergillus avenaceus]